MNENTQHVVSSIGFHAANVTATQHSREQISILLMDFELYVEDISTEQLRSLPVDCHSIGSTACCLFFPPFQLSTFFLPSHCKAIFRSKLCLNVHFPYTNVNLVFILGTMEGRENRRDPNWRHSKTTKTASFSSSRCFGSLASTVKYGIYGNFMYFEF